MYKLWYLNPQRQTEFQFDIKMFDKWIMVLFFTFLLSSNSMACSSIVQFNYNSADGQDVHYMVLFFTFLLSSIFQIQ